MSGHLDDLARDPFDEIEVYEPSDADLVGYAEMTKDLAEDLFDRDSLEWQNIELRGKLDLSREDRTALRKELKETRIRLQATERKLLETRTIGSRPIPGLRADLSRGRMTAEILDRLPPHNPELERSILGLYLLHPELLERFSQPYLYQLLYADANKRVLSCMIDLGARTCIQTVTTTLKRRLELEAAGGEVYLNELVQAGEHANPDNVMDFIDDVVDCGLRREGIHFASGILRDCYSGQVYQDGEDQQVVSWPEYFRRKSSEMMEILPYKFRRMFDTKAIADGVREAFDALKRRKGQPKISTGYRALDKLFYGIPAGRMFMIGARTKQGKTTFCLNIVKHVAEQGHGVAIFTSPSEATPSRLVQKLVANYAGVDSKKFHYWDRESIPPGHIDAIEQGIERVRELPLHFDGNKFDIDYMIGRCVQLKAQHPDLALVVVDALQSFPGTEKYRSNKSDIYYDNLKRLKETAVELGMCVIVNSQLKIDVEKYPGKRPKGLQNFSDCKGIPEVADAAVLLYRPEEYFPENRGDRRKLYVMPVALKDGDKRGPDKVLRINVQTARMYSRGRR